MAPFRKKVVAGAIKPEVIRRLRKGMPDLYEYERGWDHIVLDGEAVRCMGLAGAALKAGLCHLIAVQLEEVSPSMRHAAAKTRQDIAYEDRPKRVARLEAMVMEEGGRQVAL